MKTIPRERLELVERLWLGGATERAIQRQVRERFGVTSRAARRYLQRVRAKLTAQAKAADPDEARARAEGMLLRAYGVAEAGGQPAAMVSAARVFAEIHGALAPRRLDLGGKVEVDAQGLADELNAFLAGGAVAGPAGALPAGGEPAGAADPAVGADGGGAGPGGGAPAG